MLRIYSTVIEVLGMLRPVVAQIETHDRDLARQLRRAAASVALNVSEGSGSRGGTRRERYYNALGSARETGACLDVAEALGYLGRVDSVSARSSRPRSGDAREERHVNAAAPAPIVRRGRRTHFTPRRERECR